MSRTLAVGLPVAVVAAGMYGAAPIAQAAAAKALPPAGGLGLRLAIRLASRPIWLLGLGCEVVGFLAEAYAFSVAPASMVAPLMGCDMVVFIVLVALVFGERLARQGLTGILAMVLGVGLLALAFSGTPQLGSAADTGQLLVFLAIGVATAAAGVLVGDAAMRAGRQLVTAVAFAVTAGVSYGLATIGTRQVGLTFRAAHPWQLLGTPTPYVLAVFSVIAVAATQRGLQANAVLTFPVTSAVSALLPVLIGTTMLGDPVPDGALRVAFVCALLLVAAGVALLGRDRVAAERSVAPLTPAEPAPTGSP